MERLRPKYKKATLFEKIYFRCWFIYKSIIRCFIISTDSIRYDINHFPKSEFIIGDDGYIYHKYSECLYEDEE